MESEHEVRRPGQDAKRRVIMDVINAEQAK